MHHINMYKKILVAAATLAVFIPVALIYAADYFPKSSENMGNVSVGGKDAFRNLYVAGGTVTINKEIEGDLFAAGGSVNVAGHVEKDLFAAGGNVTIASTVGEDARIASESITINAPINGDALLAGATVVLSKNATVGGDLWAAGGVMNVNGAVAGGARLTGGEIYINSAINGPLEVRSKEMLTFGPEARVLGPIAHYGKIRATVQEGAQIGPVEFAEWEKKSATPAIAGLFGVLVIWKLLALLVAGLILVRLFHPKLSEIITSVYEKFWVNLGIGTLSLVAAPLAAILLCATIVGIYAGILLGVMFIFLILLAGVVSILLLGSIVERLIKKDWTPPLSWRTIIWGTLASLVLTLIPIIGWVLMFVLYISGLGALWRGISRRISQ